MPAPLAPFVAFALGVLFAWLARVNVPPDEPTWDHPTLAVLVYALLVYAPSSAYFVAFAGDWSYAYLLDSHAVPSAFGLLLVLLDVAALPAGFLAGRRALARHSLPALVWLGLAPLGVALGALITLHARFGVDATYAEVQSDFGTHPLPGSPLGYAILWMNGIAVTGAALTARFLLQNASVPAYPPRASPPTKATMAPPPAPSAKTPRLPETPSRLDGHEKRLLGRGRRSP